MIELPICVKMLIVPTVGLLLQIHDTSCIFFLLIPQLLNILENK
jgi:hypothetical protein